MSNLELVYGPSFPDLARRVSESLEIMNPIEAQPLTAGNGEVTSFHMERTLMGRDVVIVQTATGGSTVNAFFQTQMLIHMIKSQGANCITLLVPYFFFQERDDNDSDRTCVTLKMAVETLHNMGAARILSLDFHNRDASDLMSAPITNLRAAPLLAHAIKNTWASEKTAAEAGGSEPAWPLEGVLAVASSLSEAQDVVRMTKALGIKKHVVIDQPKHEPGRILTPEDVTIKGQHCLIVDDAIRTGKTVCTAAKLLKERGATSVRVAATHMTLPKIAAKQIKESEIDRVLVAETVPLDDAKEMLGENLTVVPVARYLAEAIRHAHRGYRMADLWETSLSNELCETS